MITPEMREQLVGVLLECNDTEIAAAVEQCSDEECELCETLYGMMVTES